MSELHVSELDRFVEAVSANGGNPHHPEVTARFPSMKLVFETKVDQALSPYSSEYFDQQIALYREIAGRELDQHEGELHSINKDALLTNANPLGLGDAGATGEHVRTLATMLSLCALSGRSRVLDMGAGHGLSSELFAFSDCRVHAVDIDPGLGEVSRERARVRNFDLIRSELNYDDVDVLDNDSYDAAFFYQSLHHCLKPWVLIAILKKKLRTGGVIAFAGEPIQDIWWRNWGLRLDEESLFVARAWGWFESGWSREFIQDCFERNGMTLTFFSGGLLGTEIAIATMENAKRDAVLERAFVLGLDQIDQGEVFVPANRFNSLIGNRGQVLGRKGYRQKVGQQGVLLYGPYITLKTGTYEFSLFGRCDPCDATQNASIDIDVVSTNGTKTHWKESNPSREFENGKLVFGRFSISDPVQRLEIRATVTGDCNWQVTLPVLECRSME